MGPASEANDLGITHVLNVSDLYVLAPGRHAKLLVEWVRAPVALHDCGCLSSQLLRAAEVPMADDGFVHSPVFRELTPDQRTVAEPHFPIFCSF